jgi:hypothetical protein
MPKNPSAKSQSSAPDNAGSTPLTLPTLETIIAQDPKDRIALYVRCDEELRGRFLIQGKVLHTLGDEGEKLLKEAGIKASSLSNARYAQIALSLADGKRRIHPGGTGKKIRSVPFTEEVFDTLTLEQCVLLAYGSTFRGSARVVQHRPSPETFDAILKMPEWDQELESYFTHGAIREMLAAAQEQARIRAAEMQAFEAAAQALRDAQAPPPPASAVPAAPSIVSTPPPPPEPVREEAAAVDQATATAPPSAPSPASNVVAFPSPSGPVKGSTTGHQKVPGAMEEEEEEEDDSLSPEAIGITAHEWQEQFETLQALSRQLAPSVGDEELQAMGDQLRELADEVAHLAPAVAAA